LPKAGLEAVRAVHKTGSRIEPTPFLPQQPPFFDSFSSKGEPGNEPKSCPNPKNGPFLPKTPVLALFGRPLDRPAAEVRGNKGKTSEEKAAN